MYKNVDVTGAFRLQALYTAFTTRIGERYHFVGERHDFWELVIVTEGEVGVTAGEKTSVLQKGEAILHYPMEFHRVWYAGNMPAQILIFTFSAENVPEIAQRQFILPDLRVPMELLDKFHQVFYLEEGWVVGLRQPELGYQIVLKELELFLLETLCNSGRAHVAANSRSAENYARIVRCLENNVQENLSVDEVARLCNMSTVNAKQTFSRYAGMGIRQYFNRLKVQKAIEMLRTGTPVQETAEMLGFSSPNYFTTTFKRITGKVPTAYK